MTGARTPSLAVGNASQTTVGGRTVVSVAVTNTGNVRIHPTGRIVLRGENGVQNIAADVKMGTVYPTDSTAAEVSLTTRLPAGRYALSVALKDIRLGISAERNNLALVVPHQDKATAPTTPPTPSTGRQQTPSGIPMALIVGLIAGSIGVGAGATAGAARLRRRRITPTR